MKAVESAERVPTIVTAKETPGYRIVTDDPDNWRMVANRPISRGEPVAPAGTAFHVDVAGRSFVEVVLRETEESRRVHTAVSAVPNEASCEPRVVEIPWCFMNHSCEPNTRDRWSAEAPASLELAETVAARDIAEGEELTFDYDLEHHDYRSPFVCRCGAESCRGTIRGFGGLAPTQQERLLAHASPFVRERHRHEAG